MRLKKLPESLKIRFIEENKNEWCIVLHAPPANAQNLLDKELRNVSEDRIVANDCFPLAVNNSNCYL